MKSRGVEGALKKYSVLEVTQLANSLKACDLRLHVPERMAVNHSSTSLESLSLSLAIPVYSGPSDRHRSSRPVACWLKDLKIAHELSNQWKIHKFRKEATQARLYLTSLMLPHWQIIFFIFSKVPFTFPWFQNHLYFPRHFYDLFQGAWNSWSPCISCPAFLWPIFILSSFTFPNVSV